MPDTWLEGEASDPHATYSLKESVALAFFASAVGGTRSESFSSVKGRSTLPASRGGE